MSPNQSFMAPIAKRAAEDIAQAPAKKPRLDSPPDAAQNTSHETDDRDPVYKVLNTTELLESILLKLSSPVQVMIMQIVNRKFRDVILGSRLLQEKGFLQAEKAADPIAVLGARRCGPNRRNTAYEFFVPEPHTKPDIDRQIFEAIKINTSVLYLKYSDHGMTSHPRTLAASGGEHVVLHSLVHDVVTNLHKDRQSCEGMFLSQPPCRKVKISSMAVTFYNADFLMRNQVIENSEGVTVDDIVHAFWDCIPHGYGSEVVLHGAPFNSRRSPAYVRRPFRETVMMEGLDMEAAEATHASLELEGCVIPDGEGWAMLEKATRQAKMAGKKSDCLDV